MTRRLDRKLDAILAGRYTPDDFIIADAKDADMAFGVAARPVARPLARAPTWTTCASSSRRTRSTSCSPRPPTASGWRPTARWTTRSRSPCGPTTPPTSGTTAAAATPPRRRARSAPPTSPAVRPFCDLVLYSVTFNNDIDRDLATLEAYRAFRGEAAEVGMRYFLEVFNPNAPVGLAPEDVGAYVNDAIIRTLAGVTTAHRPLFLKMPYNGADALAELVAHDPSRGGRHPRRFGGHHARHLRAARPRAAARRPGVAVRPQDPARGVAAGPRRADAPGAARRALPRRRRARLPRRARQGRASRPTVPSRTTWR